MVRDDPGSPDIPRKPTFGGEVYLIKCARYQDSESGWHYFGNGWRPINPTVVL